MSNRPAVLVTRPSGQAATLCDALSARGYKAFSQPLLELLALAELPPQALDSISHLDNYKHIIFISGNAVRFGMESILAQRRGMPDGIQVYAIGASTAEALQEYGVESIAASPPMTSESLLSLPQLQSVDGQKLLIVKGQGGRTRLRDVLSQRGALVDDLPCYQRRCPKLAPGELAGKLSNWQIGLLLISSGEGLCNLLTLLSPSETINLSTVPVIVPSRRVARMAEEAGFTAVFTAENASNAAMLKMVEHSSSMSENV
ncbi:MAG: uroporphyrinogen-III synthase [Proteobacteria bacterium]|nr:uroporphyrinogen-III synthase [Pseudomonadota bacterium]